MIADIPTAEEIAEAQADIARFEASGLWYADEPGEPTAAELDTSALKLFTPPPEPEHTPRERPAPRRKKSIVDRVPNPCRCHGYATTGKSGPKHKRATTAYDLCANGPTPERGDACQVYQLFQAALTSGRHPVEFVWLNHRFEPTEEDREHLDWVCWLNVRSWLLPSQLATYGRLAPTQCKPRPRNWLKLTDSERAEYDRVWREQRAIEDAARDAIVIREKTLTEFLAAFRVLQREANVKLAETCPPMARLLAATTSVEKDAAARELGQWEQAELLRRIGMTEEFIAKQQAFADRLDERNRKGSCGGMEV